jgi:hypothetical protein
VSRNASKEILELTGQNRKQGKKADGKGEVLQ